MQISLGEVIQLIREEKGLTREETVSKMDNVISVNILKNIETGRTKAQADIIPLFCKAFNCSPNYIYSYAYTSEKEYIDNFDTINDFISFFHLADDDIKYLALYLHNIFKGYFKGCILEESMISVLPVNMRKSMHFQSISTFLFAVENGLIDKEDETVKLLLNNKDEYLDMWNNLL